MMSYVYFIECFKLKHRTIWNPYVGWRVGLVNVLQSGGPNQTALQVFCLLLSRLQFCGATAIVYAVAWAAGSISLGQPAGVKALLVEAGVTMVMFPLLALLTMRGRGRSGYLSV